MASLLLIATCCAIYEGELTKREVQKSGTETTNSPFELVIAVYRNDNAPQLYRSILIDLQSTLWSL